MGGVCGRLCKSVKGEGLMQRCFSAGCGEQNQSPKPSACECLCFQSSCFLPHPAGPNQGCAPVDGQGGWEVEQGWGSGGGYPSNRAQRLAPLEIINSSKQRPHLGTLPHSIILEEQAPGDCGYEQIRHSLLHVARQPAS